MAVRAPAGPAPTTAALLGLASPASVAVRAPAGPAPTTAAVLGLVSPASVAVRAPAGPAPTTAAVLGLASPASVAVADGKARLRRAETFGRRAVRTCWTTRACSWKTSAVQSQSLRS